MSLSKAVQRCEMCKKEAGIYSCPRCNRKYCSSTCYKSVEHEVCSESFYKEWVELSLRKQDFDEKEKGNMLRILKKCYDESLENSVTDESSIVDRFAGLNVSEADEDVLWQKLSSEEKAQFQTLIKDESKLGQIVTIKQPWWTVTTLNLVSDLGEEDEVEDDISIRPIFPLNVKKLSLLTSRKPADCIQYNLVNILYGYAFLYRFYNCDFKDFLEDIVEYFFTLCPVLSSPKNYYSLEESVQDTIRLILSLNLSVSLDFIKSIVNDVNRLLQGPNNAKPATFVLCALHDIATHLLEARKCCKGLHKDLKKQIMPGAKKIEYLMSWNLDFESDLSILASNLLLLMIPDLVIETENSPTEVLNDTRKEKPLIEEIS